MACMHHQKCQKNAVKSAEDLCALQGLRFTDSRKQVFDTLVAGHKALTAKEIMETTGNKQPPITYRALEFLTESGLAHYISSINAYVGCTHAHDKGHVSQFLICKNCHDVEEIDASSVYKTLNKQAASSQFNPAETHIEILGICAECQN